MKTKKMILIMMLTGFLLCLLPSTGLAQNSSTRPVQTAVQPVMLQNVVNPNSLCGNAMGTAEDFVRVFPNGFRATARFQIPPGEAFVVTDFDWYYDDPEGAAAAGRTIVLRLWIVSTGILAGKHPVAFSTITLNEEGEGGASEHLTSGFVVSSQATICVDRDGASANASGPVNVRGFLQGE
jgi:hypothetical protein